MYRCLSEIRPFHTPHLHTLNHMTAHMIQICPLHTCQSRHKYPTLPKYPGISGRTKIHSMHEVYIRCCGNETGCLPYPPKYVTEVHRTLMLWVPRTLIWQVSDTEAVDLDLGPCTGSHQYRGHPSYPLLPSWQEKTHLRPCQKGNC